MAEKTVEKLAEMTVLRMVVRMDTWMVDL